MKFNKFRSLLFQGIKAVFAQAEEPKRDHLKLVHSQPEIPISRTAAFDEFGKLPSVKVIGIVSPEMEREFMSDSFEATDCPVVRARNEQLQKSLPKNVILLDLHRKKRQKGRA